MGQIKIIAMDLDGTLTQHKQKLDEENKAALDALSKRYKLLMAGAGQVMRIFNQLERYPVDIIGNYGLQYGKYNSESKDIDILRDLSFDVRKQEIDDKVIECLVLFDAADMAAFLDEAQRRFAHLFVGSSDAVYEEIIFFSGDKEYRHLVFPDRADVFLELKLSLEQLRQPHPESSGLHLE